MKVNDLFDLSGKKAIVTGASAGLGLGIAEGLLEAGAEVVLTGSSARAEEQAARLRRCGYAAYAVREDLLDPEAPPRLFRQALKLLNGQVDILVNNAGIQRRHKSEEFPLEDFDDVLQVNLRAVFRLSQLAGREMLRRGHGKIINVASMNSYFGGMLIPAYAASKAGVAAITRTLNNEWMSQGVSVNAIAPGYMATDMCAALQQDEKRNQGILARIPAGRWGTPNDVKGLAVFLASAASDYIGGAIIPIDGGYLAC